LAACGVKTTVYLKGWASRSSSVSAVAVSGRCTARLAMWMLVVTLTMPHASAGWCAEVFDQLAIAQSNQKKTGSDGEV
jgi:hypothetical protein